MFGHKLSETVDFFSVVHNHISLTEPGKENDVVLSRRARSMFNCFIIFAFIGLEAGFCCPFLERSAEGHIQKRDGGRFTLRQTIFKQNVKRC